MNGNGLKSKLFEATDDEGQHAPSKPAEKTDDKAPAVEKPVRQVSISMRALVYGVVTVLLVSAVCVSTWLYLTAESKLDSQARQSSNYEHAEQVALDYAVNAAQMNFQDLNAWKAALVKGTSPELKDKLAKAADSMEQLLSPLQWNSTAKPLVAKVRSDAGGVFVVDSFVSVLTKTTQAPGGLQSTATYSVTVDSNKDWQITDVGGIDAVIGQR